MNRSALKLMALVGAAIICRQVAAEKQHFPPIPENENQAPAPSFFQQATGPGQHTFQHANVDPELVRASMKARAQHDALNRKIIVRKQELYAENPTIKKLQADMRELQKQIDEILATDEKLLELKKEFESASPQMPFGVDRREPDPMHFRPPEEKNED